MQFNWSWTQKAWSLVVPVLISLMMLVYRPAVGWAGTAIVLLFGALLGVVTWFVSAGWTYKVQLHSKEVQFRDARGNVTIPLDRVGAIVRNGGFPFPTLWLVLRNADQGMEVPAKGVDPKALELIEGYRKRNPNKKVTVFSIPGGHLRSISGFIAELHRLVPPLIVDERLTRK